MSSSPLLLLPLLLLLLLLPSFSSPSLPTAYDLLSTFNLPKGLLPIGVESYLLRDDNTFDVYFDGECQFKVQDTYLLRYKRRISGRLEDGAVKDLKGVSVKALFLWFRISEVVKSGDELRFYVGLISASFPAEGFEESPKCRRGFDREDEEEVNGLWFGLKLFPCEDQVFSGFPDREKTERCDLSM